MYLERYLGDASNNNSIVHQVCASSGREIDFFSTLNNTIHYEASDISIEIAEDIRLNYPQLSTIVIDLSKMEDISRLFDSKKLVVAFGGLQYLLPSRLKLFFERAYEKRCSIIIAQPVSVRITPLCIKKSSPRGKLSWNHPYLKMAKESGLGVKYFAINYIDKNPWCQIVNAHFVPNEQSIPLD